MPLTFYDFAALTAATDNWASDVRLGKGGFGELRAVASPPASLTRVSDDYRWIPRVTPSRRPSLARLPLH